ncbi:unnamed protein product [Spirodela intermedia]|uniref:Vacuolar ATPase assembly integral membrane protein VMA21 homolog n=1 Tax=Spirodela intermedia TaxID=51605 RepID=A0A7I8JER0_SPIIN|nr:unnamed protein product [Spirodela intermedia]CAA6668644.1 unnamed protein product [Spirodela intermedia]
MEIFFASAAMWMAPVAILYAFNHKILQKVSFLITGSSELSSSSQTLLSGFLAVLSVNLVIVFYIIMAMKEPSTSQPQPDPAFLADAKASISKPVTTKRDDYVQDRNKVD